ncbi:RNA polymerase sigma-70 factor (ECF subfamily) [Paenibacillus turicensis]|uniref:RNA polymerase sigma-70 factor (ECF subfamily) n=1 Tax=Paenibacillus turicensis TaxID=160487 RepID=A0ABS4FN95_9BACL|nr:RNA polymerase sigma factor [Paenibacillus turicensis]MBP1904052.1 RNA polymerase sigma-70 factor (ECF subfamily) [Paenibacillus turicensis]
MNATGIECMYRNYSHDIYRYILYLSRNHHIAEDLTQEVFFRAYKNKDQLDGKKMKAWLLRVAHNSYIDLLRKENRCITLENEYFHDCPCLETPESNMLAKETYGEFTSKLAILQPRQQQAVMLYDIHGYSYQESAQMMGISLSQFKIILYRARQKLKKMRETA